MSDDLADDAVDDPLDDAAGDSEMDMGAPVAVEALPAPPGASARRAAGSWGESIGEQRQAELQALQQSWEQDHDDRRGPFAGVQLTGADVFWLAARTLAGPKGNLSRAEERLRAATQNEQARAGLKLSGLNLQRADLRQARLQGAMLPRARLDGANLREAHLQRAHLRVATLESVSLVNAHLQRADLSGANLRGADLRGATFDKTTRLNGIRLDGATIDQAFIESAAIGAVEWSHVAALGGELLARRRHKYAAEPPSGRNRGQRGRRKRATERTFEFRAASRTYRALSLALRAQALNANAARFRYRSLVMARKAQYFEALAALGSRRFLSAPHLFGRWLLSYLLGAVTGYGEYLGRLVATYLLAIGVFTGALFVMAHLPLSWESLRDALVFSLTSFHGRGSPPPSLAPSSTLSALSSVEGIVGLVIEGLLIGVIVNKLTRD
jgi:uncharacterized protein YjbI with pentapeptide repeats